MYRFYSLMIGYLFGNLLFAMIIGKVLLHKDPTKYGSKNPGTANVGAVFGKKWGILTCAGDLAKTLIALIIVFYTFNGNKLALAYCGLGVILGHSFPFWNKFNGGKGVAVSALWMVYFDWRAGLICLALGLILIIIMQNLSIAPIVYMLIYSIYTMVNFGFQIGLIFLIGTGIMCYKFKDDIVDYFTGKGKRVDVLKSVKQKIRS